MKFNYQELETQPFKGMRFYQTPEGKFYPSITTILGGTMPEEKAKSLKNWQNALGTVKAAKVTQAAADRGTAVHLMAERYLKKEPIVQGENFDPTDVKAFNALKLKLNKVEEVWGQEVPLFSDLLEVAGRCDVIAVYKGKPCIIDFKTSNKIKGNDRVEDYRLQLCAYACMHNEMFGTDIQDGYILMTSDGGFPQEFHVVIEDHIESLVERIEKFYDKLSSTL